MKKEQIDAMRERSGKVESDCNITAFLYILMRDHMTPGAVEGIVSDHISDDTSIYTNGWLAKYAEDVANRLKPSRLPKAERLKSQIESDKYIELIKNRLIRENIYNKDTGIEFHNIVFNALKHCLIFKLDGTKLLYEVSLMENAIGNDDVFKRLEKDFPEFA